MSEDIGRKFEIPDDPADRQRRLRRAVRVILVDTRERTLLFEDTDPGVPGGLVVGDPRRRDGSGETERQTAVREVAEETGHVLGEDELVGPLAHRRAVHGYSDQILDQDEPFYLARVPEFEIDVSSHTEEEQFTLQGHRWWTRAELEVTEAWIWPAELVQLWDRAADPSLPPLDLGTVEAESTVPL